MTTIPGLPYQCIVMIILCEIDQDAEFDIIMNNVIETSPEGTNINFESLFVQTKSEFFCLSYRGISLR